MLGSLLGLFLLILHIGQTGSFPPPLSEKEEHELLKKMAENDESARAELIEHNLRLVAHIVKKILRERRRSGRSDLHRNDRVDQGRRQL